MKISYDILDGRKFPYSAPVWSVYVNGAFKRTFDDFHAALAWVRSQPVTA